MTLSGIRLRFTISGTPELPPTVYVTLESSPIGISFGTGGTCTPVLADPTTIRCETQNSLVTRPFRRAEAAANREVFSADVPLVIPPVQPDSELTVSMSVPEGYADPDLSNNVVNLNYRAPATLPVPTAPPVLTDPPVPTPPVPTDPPVPTPPVPTDPPAPTDPPEPSDPPDPEPTPVPQLDLVLDSLPAHTEPGEDGRHRLTVRVTGIPVALGTVTLRVGGATFEQGGYDATYQVTGRSEDLELTLRSDDPEEDQVISLEVLVPSGYVELRPADNIGSTTLQAVVPDDTLAYAAGPTAEQVKANVHLVRATVAGIPSDAGSITFELPNDATEFLTASLGCRLDGDETMICEVPAGTTQLSVEFDARLPAGKGMLVARVGDQVIAAAISEMGRQPT